MKLTKIFLVTPSLTSGGAERVITELANYFSTKDNLDVSLISMTSGQSFYKLSPRIKFIQPDFDHKQFSRPVFTYKIYRFLRKVIKQGKPEAILSFGGKYNSFVLLASLNLGARTYVSDRSRPTISYGKFLDLLNPILYRKATGIVAQTSIAKEIMYKKIKHANIEVIGNPIREIGDTGSVRERIVLNVGRFITSKHQDLMIDYFAAVNDGSWQLVFLGDGPNFNAVKEKSAKMGQQENIQFPGAVRNIEEYYRKAGIFAFTTTSEGFPNALGEAISAGVPCISFNCVAGPSDLIDDGINGFLVNEYDHEEFKKKLKILMESNELRTTFSRNGLEKIKTFGMEKIGEQYLKFMLG